MKPGCSVNIQILLTGLHSFPVVLDGRLSKIQDQLSFGNTYLILTTFSRDFCIDTVRRKIFVITVVFIFDSVVIHPT